VLWLALAGCGGDRKPATAETEPAPAAEPSGRARSQSFIEAGNEAYKAADFELALKRYAAAAVADPRDPAAYFGMGMTFTRLKREDEARAAFARAQQLSRDEGTP
jgi:Flp pilus assembly protein TadD